MTIRSNNLDPLLDIRGVDTIVTTKTLTDESAFLGQALAGQAGAVASIVAGAGAGQARVTGLTGMTAASRHRFLTISGAASGANNGTFLISQFNSATSVDVINASAVIPDANNGAISWLERDPYSLEDNVNFTITDRAAIKGVAFTAAIPTYERPSAVGTNVPANLANIAGKTLDAHAKVFTRAFLAGTIAATDTFDTITSGGNLKHADAVDRTGVPIFDGADAGAHEATYVEIINPQTGEALEVLAGGNQGQRIFGRTRAGASTSPNSVEIEFRSVALGAALSTSAAYTWEAGQPTTVDYYYGFRSRLDQIGDTDFRHTLVNGLVGDADARQDLEDIRDVISDALADEATSLTGLLTNTGIEFVFSDLPDATPSVVEALNTLNAQIGDRTYTGPYLSSGQTIAASLQALSVALAAAAVVRTIERLSSAIDANTAHTLPGGISYTVDGTNNGINMYVYWRKQLRDPGPAATASNDYEETSTTQITPYTRINANDSVNYFILQ